MMMSVRRTAFLNAANLVFIAFARVWLQNAVLYYADKFCRLDFARPACKSKRVGWRSI